MATKRSTFQKRQRETDLKDKALAKQRRRADKRNQQPGGPIERGPDGLPVQGSDGSDANAGGESTAASAAPPPPPQQSTGYRPQQRGPGPRGMSPGPRMPTPAPTPAPAPAPVVQKTGPAPMYVPSKHLAKKPTTPSPSTSTTQSSGDSPKPASTTPSSSSDPRR